MPEGAMMHASVATAPTAIGGIRIPRAILWAWLVCGVLDLSSAFVDAKVNYDFGPVRLLQGVAASVLGPAAADGGLATAALGLAMHFCVAFTWTTIFYLLSRRFPVLLKWAIPSGLVYGAVVFLVMYRVVFPLTIELKALYLTNVNHTWPRLRLWQFVIHLVSVGVAISLTTRRFSPLPEAKEG
jgi:uncharacterized membrane protein YagU involved in acid resistance